MKDENKLIIDNVTTMIGRLCDILYRVNTLNNSFGIVIKGIDPVEIEKMLHDLWEYSSDLHSINCGYLTERDVFKIDYNGIHARMMELIEILSNTLIVDNKDDSLLQNSEMKM